MIIKRQFKHLEIIYKNCKLAVIVKNINTINTL